MALWDQRHVRLLALLLLCGSLPHARADARFDLTGPRIDVKVTRGDNTLPIAAVPNLQPGDKIWLHPDLPPSQSVHYLLICVFLRGTTNPPPDEWFTRIETWDKHVREEGVYVTVPQEAQQALLFMAPETGGDFSTLRSAVKGHPGVFVRAQQDLIEAGFEQARIEKYLADIRRVPPTDPADLQRHSDLLARTLALKPNPDCFKQPVDTQFTCLTQAGSQSLMDDSHAQSVVQALSNGASSDFINAASYTQAAGGGLYSAYVGAIVDLVRIMGNIHTAQFQYIPAISFPQAEAMNLRLNAPPSFKNPKSVLVIGLPAVKASVSPPLRPANANHVSCLLEPSVTLPIEGAPLVFSTGFAHDLVLHLNTPPGAPAEKDIHLIPDAYQGGLVLRAQPEHHIELHDQPMPIKAESAPFAHPDMVADQNAGDGSQPPQTQPEPITLTGTIKGMWGFDPFTGPEVKLQQLPGTNWQIITPSDKSMTTDLIAGHASSIELTSTGTACVHTISVHPNDAAADLNLTFRPLPPQSAQSDTAGLLEVSLPLEHATTPGDLHLAIQQFGQPMADSLSTRTFSEPAKIVTVELHAGDRSMILTGSRLDEIQGLKLGDLAFTPKMEENAPSADSLTASLRLSLPDGAPVPPTRADEHLTAAVSLKDGRTLTVPIVVGSARPVITLIRKTVDLAPNPTITLTNTNDLPLNASVTFTLKTPTAFPRNGQIEIETLDGTLRAVLTLAPAGGLLLQDPHTIVATFDPSRSFGPSAFGAVRLRAIYPAPPASHSKSAEETPASSAANSYIDEPPASDWLPLATLVRLPTLSLLTCPADITQQCTLDGTNLFLIDAISTDPAFDSPVAIPDGYTGNTLTVPHPAGANTLFLKLRDDPAPIDTASLPVPAPSVPAPHTHTPAKSAPKPAASASTPASNSVSPAEATPGSSPQSPVSTPQTLPTPASQSAAATPKPTTTTAH